MKGKWVEMGSGFRVPFILTMIFFKLEEIPHNT